MAAWAQLVQAGEGARLAQLDELDRERSRGLCLAGFDANDVSTHPTRWFAGAPAHQMT